MSRHAQQQYAYHSLDQTKKEIRLIRLAPCSPKQQRIPSLAKISAKFLRSGRPIPLQSSPKIVCSFQYANLDNAPEYEAISYAWEDQPANVKIYLDKKPFLITQTLHLALLRLRLPDKDRVLWVDAICVDQGSNTERNHQVGLMRGIYAKASHVIVWLGEDWKGCDQVMNAIKTLAENHDIHMLRPPDSSIASQNMTISHAQLQKNILRFFNLPWWHRLWTVQEYVLAKQVIFQCGTWQLSSEVIRSFAKTTDHHVLNCCSSFLDVYQQYDKETRLCLRDVMVWCSDLDIARRRPSNDFLFTLFAFRNRVSSDPRDKLYGMLALATGKYAALIEPDYTLPIEVVYENAAMAFINRTGTLDIFSHLYGIRNRNITLPSYIPDWTANTLLVKNAFDPRYWWFKGLQTEFQASGNSTAKIISSQPGMLTLSGVFFDTILRISKPVYDTSKIQEWKECAQSYDALNSPYGSSYSAQERVFWRCLSGDMIICRDSQLRPLIDDLDFPKYKQWAAWYSSHPDDKTHALTASALEFFDTHDAVGTCRSFAVTEKGYIGFVPLGAKPGDRIAVLLGGKVPYILRRVEDNKLSDDLRKTAQPYYEILGDGYIHGIMKGEVLEEGNERGRGVSLEDITLI